MTIGDLEGQTENNPQESRQQVAWHYACMMHTQAESFFFGN